MTLDNIILKWSDNFIYLGTYFVLGLSLNVSCKNKIKKIVASISSVLYFKLVGYKSAFAKY